MIKYFDSIQAINDYIDSKIKGSFLVPDIDILGRFVQQLNEGDKYLEIGVSFGKSLASAIFQAPEGVKFYCCDIYDEPRGQNSLSRKEFFATEKLDTVAEFFMEDSKKLAKTWNGGQLAMIFIDANHDYEAVKSDIRSWFPHLKSGGWMFFHDYDIPTFGVQSAVNELVKNSKEFTDFFYARELYGVGSSIAGGRKI